MSILLQHYWCGQTGSYGFCERSREEWNGCRARAWDYRTHSEWPGLHMCLSAIKPHWKKQTHWTNQVSTSWYSFLLPLGGAKLSIKKLEFVISLQCQHTKSVFTPAIIEIDKLSTREVCVTPRQITVNKVQTLVKYNVTKMSTSVVVLGLFLFLNEPVHLSTILFNNV